TNHPPARHTHEAEGSWYASGQIALSWQTRLGSGWFADAAANQEITTFDGSPDSDFQNTNLHLGVSKTWVDAADALFFARYEYQHLATNLATDQDYDAHRFRLGVLKELPISPRQKLEVDLHSAFDLTTSPHSLKRQCFSVAVHHTFWFHDRLHLLTSWRAEFWNFQSGRRDDWAQSLGIRAVWRISTSTSSHLSFTYHDHESNASLGANEFSAWQLGAGLGICHRF
ncbi:MAG: hypothetical protein ACQKBU_10445, partial [Verrucomicrobiales bacterium]